MLARVLSLRTTVAIVGSGCSRPLGYPSWTGLAAELFEVTLRELEKPESPEKLARCHEMVKTWLQAEKEGQQKADAKLLMFCINTCQRELEAAGLHQIFLRVFQDHLGLKLLRKLPEDGRNPIEALLELDIRRFVTTNYDCLIEKTIELKQGLDWRRFGIRDDRGTHKGDSSHGGPLLSFTQEPGYAEELARFALERTLYREPMVFHCHGRFDRPDSIIASERDYQRWYVADTDVSGVAFRQTNKLLLESNPLLFVGYSLSDLDFLQPLRRLLATNPFYQQSRPIFALMPVSSKALDREKYECDISHFELLHERYGLHVLTYEKPLTEGLSEKRRNRAWGARLSQEIQKIHRDWLEAQDRWFRKPPARKLRIAVSPPEPCLVTKFSGESLRDASSLQAGSSYVDRAIELIEKGARVLFLHGRSGVGKSATSVQLIDRLKAPSDLKRRGFEGFFFWNAHYDNEALIAQERALAYLSTSDDHEQDVGFGDLPEILRARRFLIVIDGCERLLEPGKTPKERRIFARSFRDLIESAAQAEKGSVLVLAGRRWPADLDDLRGQLLAARKNSEDVDRLLPRLDLSRLNVDALDHSEGEALCFAGLGSESRPLIGKVVSLLNGHDYAMLLASAYIEGHAQADGGSAKARRGAAEQLCRELSHRSPEQRRAAMVRLTIDSLGRESDEARGLFRHLVDRLALFTVPFSKSTFHHLAALELGEPATGQPWLEPAEALERLQRAYLLFEVKQEGSHTALVVHPVVRESLISQRQSPRRESFPDFGLQGFTTRGGGMDPGSPERNRLFEETFEALRNAGAAGGSEVLKADEQVDRCRDLYALVRGQSDAVGAFRWEHEDRRGNHVRRTIQLVALAKEVSAEKQHWSYRSRDRSQVRQTGAALHLGELLWLYNDNGLSLFIEGLMPDAYAVWEQTLEIARVIEGPDTPGRYTAEVLLNLMYVFFEMGRVSAAHSYLEEVDRISQQIGDVGLEARVLGFHGILQHIQGNVRSAKGFYERADELLRDRNPRALSFFQGLNAQLEIRLGDLKRAEFLARSARALAESNRYPDLAISAQVFQVEVMVANEKLPEARMELNEALRRASDIGARWLEAIILQSLSRVVLVQGDVEGGRGLAMRALGLANELGLGLVMTRSLQALGLATVKAPGGHPLGLAYLRLAKELADTQQYWLRSRDLEKDLLRNGVNRQL